MADEGITLKLGQEPFTVLTVRQDPRQGDALFSMLVETQGQFDERRRAGQIAGLLADAIDWLEEFLGPGDDLDGVRWRGQARELLRERYAARAKVEREGKP